MGIKGHRKIMGLSGGSFIMIGQRPPGYTNTFFCAGSLIAKGDQMVYPVWMIRLRFHHSLLYGFHGG